MTKKEKLSSIVILSLNRYEDLKNGIDSIIQNTTKPYELVILDNGSDDASTLEYLSRINGTSQPDGNGSVKVIFNDKNVGCSAGRNLAVKHASGRYIVTMDNDMIYTPGWLDKLIERAEDDPKIGAVSCRIVFPDGTVQWNGGYINRRSGNLADFMPVDHYKSADSTALTGRMDCDWLPGGATLIKRKILDSGVEHNPAYVNGYEDYDYSLRVKKEGYRLVNCPESVVVHHHRMFNQEKKHDKYLKDRSNKSTLLDAAVLLLETTGYNLLEELYGSAPYKAKFGAAHGSEMDDIIEQELGQNGGINTLKLRRVSRETTRDRRRDELIKQYCLDSLDIENPAVQNAVTQIKKSYEKAKYLAPDFDLDAAINRACAIIQDEKQKRKTDNTRFFDSAGAVSDEGVKKIFDDLRHRFDLIKDDSKWKVESLMSQILIHELRYFGVDEANLIDANLRQNIIEAYELDRNAEFKDVRMDSEKSFIEITSGSAKLLLKCWDADEEYQSKELEKEEKISEYVAGTGFTKLAKPVKVKKPQEDESTTTVKIGKKAYRLYDYLDGEHAHREHSTSLARTIAELHKGTKDSTIKEGKELIQYVKDDELLKQYFEKVNKADESKNPFAQEEKQFMQKLSDYLEKLNPENLPKALCHSNIYDKNTIVAGGNVHLIDWQEGNTDYRLTDITLAAHHFCIDQKGMLDYTALSNFIKEYDAIAGLTQEEKEAIPAFLQLIVPHVIRKLVRKTEEGQLISDTEDGQAMLAYLRDYFTDINKSYNLV